MKRKLIALWVLVALLLNSFAYADTADAPEDEFERAVSLGFISEAIQGDPDAPVTEKEIAAMLSAMLASFDSSLAVEWDAFTAGAGDRRISRDYGALFLLYAAERMGYASFTDGFAPYSGNTDWDAMWASMTGDYPLFGQGVYDICESISAERGPEERLDYPISALQYAMSRLSQRNRLPLMELDENYSMRCAEPMTKREAAIAMIRLYDSEARIVTCEQAKASTIDFDKLANAADMPEVSAQSIPRWRGNHINTNLTMRQHGRPYVAEQDIADIADMGFNYLRLMLFWFDFCAVKEDMLTFNPEWLESFDRVVEWCAKYRIHLCIDMHALPGYGFDNRTVMEDEQSHTNSLLVWDVLSARYADVPSNLLSYNLVNEPDANYFTDESYAVFATEMIETIRKNDSTQKLLVSDGMLDGDSVTSWGWDHAVPSRPVEQLPKDVMQTIHLYPWHSLATAGFVSLLDWPYEHAGAVNNNIPYDQALRITGDFPAGTVVRLYVSGVYLGDEDDIQCMADGKLIGAYPRSFTLGEDNCTEIADWASFDTRQSFGYLMEFTVPDACGEISVGDNLAVNDILILIPAEGERVYPVPHGGKMHGFVYETGAYDTLYIRTANAWEQTASTIHLNADGFYTVENPAQRDIFDYETLRAYVARWAQWSKDTGTPIMCNEFGVSVSLPEEARVGYMRSVLDLFEEYGIAWAVYADGYECFTPIISEESIQEGHSMLPADGSLTYRDGYWVDEPMLALFREYME